MELIAHRGASGYAPENTLASFKKALEMKVSAIEMDVQLTKDNRLVVIHDFDLKRVTGQKGLIMNTDYETISKLDAGSWFSDEFKGEQIPLLEDVLKLVPEEVTLHLELKAPALDKRPIEMEVLNLVKQYRSTDSVVFSSFNHRVLKGLDQYKDLKIGVLFGSGIINIYSYLMTNKIDAYSINQSGAFITPELAQSTHEKGRKLLSYTINDYELAKMFESFGVDGIFTNYPDLFDKF